MPRAAIHDVRVDVGQELVLEIADADVVLLQAVLRLPDIGPDIERAAYGGIRVDRLGLKRRVVARLDRDGPEIRRAPDRR